jgi:hypothetical protein
MNAVPPRRERIARIVAFGHIAARTREAIATAEPATMAPELAAAVQALAEAARLVTEVAEQELLALENARDFGDAA